MTDFNTFGLRPEILQAIEKLGFEKALPIQAKAIPLLLKTHKDLIGLAQTGTGKTAAFGLPIVHKLDMSMKKPQALILAPTRELCLQITNDIQSFSKYIDGMSITAVYGGADIGRQVRAIQKGTHVIVATPGRMNDLLNKRKKIDSSMIRTVVLDEADEMLNMGFKEELDAILGNIPEGRQTLLFSATMAKEVQRIAETYMQKDAEKVTVGNKNAGAENVKHVLYTVRSKDKYLALKRILDFNPDIYGIVFCRTRVETKRVAAKLMHDGYNADALHGDLSQSQREQIMKKFRIRNLQVLVATDVAARGLDVKDITHVINYDLPDDVSTYTHRSGRTGRAGQSGISIVLANMKNKNKVKQIERNILKSFEICSIPTGKEVCEQQLLGLIDRMQKIDVNDADVDKFLPVIKEKLGDISQDELIKRFISLEFNILFDYYKNSKDFTPLSQGSKRSDRREGKQSDGRRQRSDKPVRKSKVEAAAEKRSEKQDGTAKTSKPEKQRELKSEDKKAVRKENSKQSDDFKRYFINLGFKDGVNPRDMIELINACVNKKGLKIGKIDLMKSFSFFEVSNAGSAEVMRSFSNINVNNKDIFVEIAQKDTWKQASKSGNKSSRSKRSSSGKKKASGKDSRKKINGSPSDFKNRKRRTSRKAQPKR